MSGFKKLNLPAAAAVCLGLSVCMTAILCVPGALAMGKGFLPLSAAPLWAALSAGLSVLASTLAAVRVRRRQALPTGAAAAGGYILLAAAVCALCGGACAFGHWLVRLSAAVLAGGLLGALLSVRQNPHGKRRR